MTSREIAELTGKEHKHVLADIRGILECLGLDGPEYRRIYFDSMNRQQTEFALDRELTYTLLAGYSIKMRRVIVARWQELEAKTAPAPLDLGNPAALRAALLGYTEKVIQLEAKVCADAPKVAFAEAIRAVDGVCSIEKIAKTIGHGRNKFFKRLRDDGVLQENNLPYQKYIDREYFTVIEQEPFTDSKGKSHPTFTTRVTGAGQVFLAKRYAIAMRATDALAVTA